MKFPSASALLDKYIISQPRLRERMTRILYGDTDRTIALFTKPVTINALRENGYYRASRLSRHSSLLRDEVLIFSRLPFFFEEDMTFVDIGANIGMFSIIMADFQNLIRNFNVVAFEVNPDTFSRLADNAREHDFVAHNVGISATRQTISFVEGAVSHVTRTTDNSNRYSIADRVFAAECRPLGSFDIAGKLILKLDVEGHEFAALEGARSFFESGRVKCVYIDGYGEDDRIPAFFEHYGFEMLDCGTMKPAVGAVHMLLAVAPGALPAG